MDAICLSCAFCCKVYFSLSRAAFANVYSFKLVRLSLLALPVSPLLLLMTRRSPRHRRNNLLVHLEGHLSHDFNCGTWVSLDGNFSWGGVTTLNGIQNLARKQTGSRIRATAAWRFSKHQSVKVNNSDGGTSDLVAIISPCKSLGNIPGLVGQNGADHVLRSEQPTPHTCTPAPQ